MHCNAPHICHKYGLRRRKHNYTLNIKTDFDDRNFYLAACNADVV